jgi:hypothetical protein
MFIENGKWNFPLLKIAKGELKASPSVLVRLTFVALLIKVVVINAIIFVVSPENFPAPIAKWLVSFIVE